ncbi:MAG: CPBP family intramembrane metalloprotease [Anaerolineales bacterium]|nr:CPBP family intramembrane metalloprotease [Anaerolineales bacterium]
MNAVQTDAKKTLRNLVIFVIAINLIGWLAIPLNQNPEAQGLGMLIWLAAPLVVSLLLRAFAGDGWEDFGLGFHFKGNGIWYVVSILIYPLMIGITLLVGRVFGALTFANGMLGLFLPLLIPALVTNFFKNIFEEFAWRGYLASKMYSLKFNTMIGHVLVGLVWGGWHIPYYLGLLDQATYQSYTSQPLAVFLPLVFLGTIAASILYGEIRIRTNSVWPAVLLHTIVNAVALTLLTENLVQFKAGLDAFFSPGIEGILMIILTAGVGVWLYNRRAKSA